MEVTPMNFFESRSMEQAKEPLAPRKLAVQAGVLGALGQSLA
ncbi:MAG: hypothetical protein ACJAQT_005214 [Akkermansiaceae bacterium]|jgi:hypothetical protein